MTISTLLLVLITATPSGGAGDVTLLDFTAEWCGPCKQMRPTIERFAEEGLPVKAIDIDKSPRMAQRYNVESVPTFIVVDASGKEIARTKGAQPAAELERFFQSAKEKASRNAALVSSNRRISPNRVPSGEDSDDEASAEDTDDPDGENYSDSDNESRVRKFENPKAWETVVRIRVIGNGSIGFGSGTIIHSTPEESLILTCAHVFKLDGRRDQPPASKFPRKVMIDLFDGNLQGEKPAHVNYAESMEGKAVDYDFTLDVGLIRIRPGRRLPSARVVPAHWTPAVRMHMLTVGCSEGRDASVWATKILKPKMKGLSGNPNYEAIECAIAPIQGRSGGGLFTDDGYVAGVCNFAETRGNVGLYATPTSIYRILDRNRLMALYAPVSKGNPQLLAGNQGKRPGGVRRNQGEDSPAIERGQSPEPDDSSNEAESELVMIPSPEMLKIKVPGDKKSRIARSSPQVATASSTKSWQLRSKGESAKAQAVPTEANIDRSVEFDAFESFDDDKGSNDRSESRKPVAQPDSKSKSSDQLNWRSVNSAN